MYFFGVAQAASFDCSKARNTQERLICSNSNLSTADSQLGNVYGDALTRLSVTDQHRLRDDERNWLKGISNFCPVFLGGDQPLTVNCLIKAYSYRIAYLKSVGPQSMSAQVLGDAQARLVAQSIQDALPTLISSGETILDSVIKWNMITPPTETTYQSYSDLITSLPAPPDDATQTVFTDFLQSAEVIEPIKWLPKARLGALSESGGNAGCQTWIVFTSDDTSTHIAPLPETLQTDLCSADGHFAYLGSFGSQPVAITESDPAAGITGGAIGKVVIALQVWEGTQWSAPAAFNVNLSYPLGAKPFYKSCLSVTCDDVAKLGYQIASKFQTTGAIVEPLSQADAAKFSSMQSADNFGDTTTFPDIGGQHYIGLSSFGPDSVVFPAHLDGALVLGRIGHGTIGWRVDSNWNIAFWRLNGTELEPVAAVIFGLGEPVLDSVSDLPSWKPELH